MNSIKRIKKIIGVLTLTTTIGIVGCNKNIDVQTAVTFGPTFYASARENSTKPIEIVLNFSQPLYEDAQIKINVNSNGVVYGNAYTTNPPELVAGEIILSATSGSSFTSFTVSPVDNDVFTNGSKIKFSVSGLNGILKSFTGKDFTFEVIDDDLPPLLAKIPFDGCTQYQIPSPFTEETVPGFKTDRGWGCYSNGLKKEGLRASAYGGNSGSDNAWLILNLNKINLNSGKKLNLSSLTSLYFKVLIESYYDGPGTISMKYSFNYPGTGNPEKFEWTLVEGFESQLPQKGSGRNAGKNKLFVPVFVSLKELAGKEKAFCFSFSSGSYRDRL
jgi:hypothetical protein